jgi:hypothetical protein
MRHFATRSSAAVYAVSTAATRGSQPISVELSDLIASASPSSVNFPPNWLQPLDPETVEASKLIVGVTASHPSTSRPDTSCHGTFSSDAELAAAPSSSPQPAISASASTAIVSRIVGGVCMSGRCL